MTNERPENVWATTLPNGLRVRVLCKPDFQRSYAVFATCYGGADRRFRVGDTWTDTPAGVAHYLEHKLFDMPDGSDALLTLSENGADPNAFTSTNMTAYYFSCTDGFKENLRTLLRFVEHGGGVSVASEIAARDKVAEGSICALRITDPGMDFRDVEVQTLAGRSLPVAVQAFLELLRQSLPGPAAPPAAY